MWKNRTRPALCAVIRGCSGAGAKQAFPTQQQGAGRPGGPVNRGSGAAAAASEKALVVCLLRQQGRLGERGGALGVAAANVEEGACSRAGLCSPRQRQRRLCAASCSRPGISRLEPASAAAARGLAGWLAALSISNRPRLLSLPPLASKLCRWCCCCCYSCGARESIGSRGKGRCGSFRGQSFKSSQENKNTKNLSLQTAALHVSPEAEPLRLEREAES